MDNKEKWYIIEQELTNDPLARGYSGMDDVAAFASLTDSGYGTQSKASLSGSEIFAATDSTEFGALTPESRNEWLTLCAIDSVDPSNGLPAAATAVRLFGGASTTVSNLNTLRTIPMTRAEELGVGSIVLGDVQNARAGIGVAP